MIRGIIFSGVCLLSLIAARPSRGDVLTEGGVILSPSFGTTEVGTSNLDGTLRITAPSTYSTGNLRLALQQPARNGYIFVEGGTLLVSDDTEVGSTGRGHLQITGAGLLETNDLFVGGIQGFQPGAEGTLIVDGANAKLRVRASVAVGALGFGELLLRNGASMQSSIQTTNQFATIGDAAGSVGSVVVDGEGTDWQHSGRIRVGDAGTGSLSILAGGSVTSSGAGIGVTKEGSSQTSLGSTTIDGFGSRWTTSSLAIGEEGVGEVRVSSGGLLQVTGFQQFSATTLGSSLNSFGRLVVTDPGSRWTNNVAVVVGAQGSGELWIENGAIVVNGDVDIAQSSQGSGFAVVRGAQTRWHVGSLSVAQSGGGLGTLEIADGATVAITGFAPLDIGLQGRVTLDDGTLSMGTNQAVNNAGWFGGHGRVTAGVFVNVGGARLTVGADELLRISNNLINAGGRVEVTRGELEVGGQLTNGTQSTVVVDHGALTMRGSSPFTNLGTASFVGQNNIIRGNVTNTGSMTVAGNSQATFYNNLTNTEAGVLKASTGSTLTVLGAFQGSGVTGPGTVFLEGPVLPGSSPGVMSFGGDLNLGSQSALKIEVEGITPGTEHDQLTVAGLLTLGGSLSLEVLGDLNAATTLTIASAGEISGAFSSIPAVGDYLGFGARFNGLTYDYDEDKVLVALLPPLPADFNRDGTVDGADFLKWQQDLGSPADPQGSGADGDDDGAVDEGDLAVWKQGFSGAPATSTALPVPEPTSAGLTLVGVLFVLGGRFRVARSFCL